MTKDEFIKLCSQIPEKKIRDGNDMLLRTSLWEIRHLARGLVPKPKLSLVASNDNEKGA